MKALLRTGLLAVAILLACGSGQRLQAAEVIEQFDAVIDVAPNGNLTVTETIRVRAEGREIKRGIYRDFPLTFIDSQDRSRQVTFKLIDVTRDNRPEPHFT